MAKCKNCGAKVARKVDKCPDCGMNMTAQTITDLPKTKIRREKKPEDITVPSKERQVVCEHCRSPVPGNIKICPKCGLNMTAQTITDLPPWKEG